MADARKPINLTVSEIADETAAAAAITDLVRQKSPEWENQKQMASWRRQLLEALDLVSAFGARGRSVNTLVRRTRGPNLGVINRPLRAISPKPASMAMGMLHAVSLPPAMA